MAATIATFAKAVLGAAGVSAGLAARFFNNPPPAAQGVSRVEPAPAVA